MIGPGRARRRIIVLGIGLAAIAAACAAPRGVPQVDRSELTKAAVAAVGTGGRFVLPAPWKHTSPARADSVALAAARFRARMSPADGAMVAAVDHARLRVCGRKYYVLAIAGPVPSHVAHPIRLGFGPRWVVPLCSPDGKSPVSVEVADGESVLEIAPSGEFASPFSSDGEYSILRSDDAYDAGVPLVLQVADRQQPDSATIEYPVFIGPGANKTVSVQSARVPFVLPVAFDSVAIIDP